METIKSNIVRSANHNKFSVASGSKIPITTIEIIVRDKVTRKVVYHDIEVVQGHNLPSAITDEIRNRLKLKYQAEINKGIPHEQLRRVFGQ